MQVILLERVAKLGQMGEVVKVKVTGVAGIPTTGVGAVVVNLGAVAAKSYGWLVAYPSGQAKPATSTLNYRAGWTGSATATVPVGSDGTITVIGLFG